uniref:RNA-directed DNA polymerase, eukaryota, reverse transcriptase zinc-binding domain protein n=1 Tax=Tanacetum cinerariifolium TaxID=118510 RepID=A0A699HBC0_TANCI|nr:RNA-directed DNA polymerase, eukaryota, reverse transcriptase zinc-binding domain protein [Tanacetum cinerariifolium]
MSSRLGKPLVIDNMTASMCHNGNEMVAYARVMIEIDAKKRCQKNRVNIDKHDEKKKYQRKQDDEGFIEDKGNIQYMYKPKEDAMKNQQKPRKVMQKNEDQFKTPNRVNNRDNESPSKKMWNVGTKIVEELKKLQIDIECEVNDVAKNLVANKIDGVDTTDVMAKRNSIDFNCSTWNIKGMCTEDKQNEIRNFIMEEHLSICGVLETHLKDNRVSKIGNVVFGN